MKTYDLNREQLVEIVEQQEKLLCIARHGLLAAMEHDRKYAWIPVLPGQADDGYHLYTKLADIIIAIDASLANKSLELSDSVATDSES